MIGIDEIGVEIEEPFCILPVHDLSLAAKRDIGIAVQQADALRDMHAKFVDGTMPLKTL